MSWRCGASVNEYEYNTPFTQRGNFMDVTSLDCAGGTRFDET